jgi:hypothetical protein
MLKQMPKTVRWVLTIALMFLLAMSLYRLGLHFFYKPKGIEGKQLMLALWSGFRYDLRYVSFVTILVMLFGLLPDLHPFKRSLGKKIALILYSAFAAGMLLLYAADIIYIISFDERLNGSLVYNLKHNTQVAKLFWHNTPWVTVAIAIAVIVWLFWLLASVIHRTIQKKVKASHSGSRIYWQAMVFAVCLAGLHGHLGRKPLSVEITRQSKDSYVLFLAVNPPQAFLETLPRQAKAIPKPKKD